MAWMSIRHIYDLIMMFINKNSLFSAPDESIVKGGEFWKLQNVTKRDFGQKGEILRCSPFCF
jgi:hypothetical protein